MENQKTKTKAPYIEDLLCAPEAYPTGKHNLYTRLLKNYNTIAPFLAGVLGKPAGTFPSIEFDNSNSDEELKVIIEKNGGLNLLQFLVLIDRFSSGMSSCFAPEPANKEAAKPSTLALVLQWMSQSVDFRTNLLKKEELAGCIKRVIDFNTRKKGTFYTKTIQGNADSIAVMEILIHLALWFHSLESTKSKYRDDYLPKVEIINVFLIGINALYAKKKQSAAAADKIEKENQQSKKRSESQGRSRERRRSESQIKNSQLPPKKLTGEQKEAIRDLREEIRKLKNPFKTI